MSRPNANPHHAFVGFIGGSSELEHAVEIPTHGDTKNLSDADSYQEEDQYEDTGSIRSVKKGGLRSDTEEYNPDYPYLKSPREGSVYTTNAHRRRHSSEDRSLAYEDYKT